MEQISVFDMFKIGIGPSSSHTLGPWRAAERWIGFMKDREVFESVIAVNVTLYGSLSLTGLGHATDKAVILGLSGEDPESIPIKSITKKINRIKRNKELLLGGNRKIIFDPDKNIVFERRFLSFHPNGLTFEAVLNNGKSQKETYYSIGGGFILRKKDEMGPPDPKFLFPYPVHSAQDLFNHCNKTKKCISELVMENEKALRPLPEVKNELLRIWDVMLESMFLGCHAKGILPGGLKVKRRAGEMYQNLVETKDEIDARSWFEHIRKSRVNVQNFFKWIGCFALSVNEVNASLGRIVTAPTNGSAGVIPAVLMYYLCFINKSASKKHIIQFLLVAGEMGSIFKKGATISAAMGGCQAEIGVSSAMAAAALTEVMGGTPAQSLVAAEIAMEHHLGLTCDPIGGLVQIPCIERNSMGAVKAVNAAQLALERNPKDVKVPLDQVIQTMWQTAKDMSKKYKETSEGGLAIAVNMPDC